MLSCTEYLQGHRRGHVPLERNKELTGSVKHLVYENILLKKGTIMLFDNFDVNFDFQSGINVHSKYSFKV